MKKRVGSKLLFFFDEYLYELTFGNERKICNVYYRNKSLFWWGWLEDQHRQFWINDESDKGKAQNELTSISLNRIVTFFNDILSFFTNFPKVP